ESGSRASGLLRSARKAAQFAHPGASVGVTPATVATMAAVVIVGGGAAVGLLQPGHATASQRGAATISARPTAVKRAVKAGQARTAGPQLGQAASVSRTSGGSTGATRSGTPQTSQAPHGASNAAPATRPAGAPATSTHASGPTTPSTSPAPPAVHVPGT